VSFTHTVQLYSKPKSDNEVKREVHYSELSPSHCQLLINAYMMLEHARTQRSSSFL